MWLTRKLISECKPNSSFSANHWVNENDQDSENHSNNKSQGNYPANNTCPKSTLEKKFCCLCGYLWTYFTPRSSVLMSISNMWLFTSFFFHYKYQRFMFYMHRKSSYFSSKFFKECFLYITLKFILLTLNFLDFLPRFNSHFRLVQATLKSIIFVQNH